MWHNLDELRRLDVVDSISSNTLAPYSDIETGPTLAQAMVDACLTAQTHCPNQSRINISNETYPMPISWQILNEAPVMKPAPDETCMKLYSRVPCSSVIHVTLRTVYTGGNTSSSSLPKKVLMMFIGQWFAISIKTSREKKNVFTAAMSMAMSEVLRCLSFAPPL